MFKRVINIRSWLDWDRLRSSTRYIGTTIKNMFVPQKAEGSESFNEAISTLKLSEEDLTAKQNSLYRLSMVMLSIALIIFMYSGYQLYVVHIKASLVSLIVMMIALALAFRYHFWYFQIKKRKLGCTFKEWYRQGLLGEKE